MNIFREDLTDVRLKKNNCPTVPVSGLALGAVLERKEARRSRSWATLSEALSNNNTSSAL